MSVRFDPAHVVATRDQLEALVGKPRQAQLTKALPRLDDHCRRWIAASPFVVVCSANAQGRMDISPKGDPGGFVSVLDDTTLAIPDRRGNHRLDTFHNVLENPEIAVLFLVPKRGETLRVMGRASVVTDPDLLTALSEGGQAPALAMVVDVRAAMFHCGKSMIRSGLWKPEQWNSVDGLASYAECLADQADTDESVDDMERRFATWHEGNELY